MSVSVQLNHHYIQTGVVSCARQSFTTGVTVVSFLQPGMVQTDGLAVQSDEHCMPFRHSNIHSKGLVTLAFDGVPGSALKG
jgi:hypothetical protein